MRALDLQALHAQRLTHHPATRSDLEASILSSAALAASTRLAVAQDWPPRFWEPISVNWLLSKLSEHPDEPFWRAWFICVPPPPSNPRQLQTIVGAIGFKGPPGPPGSDTHATIEIGYSVVTSHHRRRLATDAVATLLAWAAADPRIHTFRAHTLANDPASSGVLLHNRFTRTATLNDPDDGPIDRYERAASTT